jgi:hypothetical protein
VRQAASPVRWVETMQAMQAAGVTHVFECGPGKVLRAGQALRRGLGRDRWHDLPAVRLQGAGAALRT